MRRRQHTRAPRPAGCAPTEVAVVEGLQQLIELQKLDEELATHEEEHASLPARREALASQQAAAEAQLAAEREALRAAELEQRQAEAALRDREAAVAKLEGQQFQVKTNEAYTALLREIDHARAAVSGCETRILEAMEAIERCAGTVAAAEDEAKTSSERAAAGGRTLAAREAELDARLAELRGRRAEARGRVERDLIELYERIAARKRPAVVTVTKEICPGCRVDIPPQRFVEILSRARVVTCGRCQRILIHADA
jgi:predicted  nucleic acid-binding Zn-ribbon protein